ncbi:MAG: glycosyltransferase [Phycisphaerae bacterium]|nr:glycosyltransferase [Phycisphaerae bacterium]
MEVRSTAGCSYRYLLWCQLLGAVYLGMLVGPGLWWPGYYVVVGYVVFGLILFFSFRSHVQAAFALRRTRPGTCIRQGSEQACFGLRDWDFGFGGSAAPRVSLVIPSFNEEAVLRQTIPSVLALDYPAEAIEFLYIYESASTDRTAHVIEAFARKNAQETVVHCGDPEFLSCPAVCARKHQIHEQGSV